MSKNINLSESSTTGPNVNKVHNLDWIDINARCSSGDTLLKRAPAKHAAALAQVGMVVSVPDLLEGNGIIVAVYPDHAIIEGENEERVMALWGEIAIEVVEPDPAELPVMAKPTADAQPAPSVEFEQRENWYSPELATWASYGAPHSIVGTRTFTIHEDTGIPLKEKGALVATITVAPEYGLKDARKIADLMAAAPDLFRHLRIMATYGIDGVEGVEAFNAAVQAMFLAIGWYPYDVPSPNELDESIGKKLNASRGRVARA